jgi:uncharacterized protein GlcG (DUF336 family)
MTVAVLDARGCVVALKMEDGSRPVRPEIASCKAWSSLGLGFVQVEATYSLLT